MEQRRGETGGGREVTQMVETAVAVVCGLFMAAVLLACCGL